MADLTKICGTVNKFGINADCTTDVAIGYPVLVVMGAYSTPITAALAIPTPAEVQSYLDNGDGVAFRVTNGVKLESEVATKTGADTFSNVDEVITETEGISVTLRKLNNSILEAIKGNNINFTQMRLFWVDSNNRWHGGTTGYFVPNYIKSWSHAGFNEEALINQEFKWRTNMYEFIEISDADADYLTLDTVLTATYTETVVVTYVAGQVVGYNEISGWNKTNYPTLYFAINTNVITIYPTSADRTADTNALATIDSADALLPVVEANASGFAGKLGGVANDIVDASTWNVTYSEA